MCQRCVVKDLAVGDLKVEDARLGESRTSISEAFLLYEHLDRFKTDIAANLTYLLLFHVCWALKARVNDLVSLQSRDQDVGDPKRAKDARGDPLNSRRTAELSTDPRTSTNQQDNDGNQCLTTEEGDRKAQAETVINV